MRTYDLADTKELRRLGHDLVEYEPLVGEHIALCTMCLDHWKLSYAPLAGAKPMGNPPGPPLVPQWQGPRQFCPGPRVLAG